MAAYAPAAPHPVLASAGRVLCREPSYRELLYHDEGIAAGLSVAAVRIGNGSSAEIAAMFTDIISDLGSARAGGCAADAAPGAPPAELVSSPF